MRKTKTVNASLNAPAPASGMDRAVRPVVPDLMQSLTLKRVSPARSIHILWEIQRHAQNVKKDLAH